MIDYRFLYPAEEEMIEASSFYEAGSDGLGHDFLADVQFGIDGLREHPHLGLINVGLESITEPSAVAPDPRVNFKYTNESARIISIQT